MRLLNVRISIQFLHSIFAPQAIKTHWADVGRWMVKLSLKVEVGKSARLPLDAHLPIGQGELAQMVERSLSMREVRGSMPRFSR